MLEIMSIIMIVGIFYLDANETAAADNIQIQAFAAVARYQGKQHPGFCLYCSVTIVEVTMWGTMK